MEQQSDRWGSLLSVLKEIKARGIYDSAPSPTTGEDPNVQVDGEKDQVQDHDQGVLARLTAHDDDVEDTDDKTIQARGEGLIPLDTFSSLSTSLANLLAAFNSTSTTRTSLLSTVEGYSSYLHRQVYRRSQPGPGGYGGGSGGGSGAMAKSGGGYSLETLSANLAKAGGSSGAQSRSFDIYGQNDGEDGEARLEDMGVKSGEWDAVRKEVRAIKGMLLSRRNFVADGEAR